MHKHSLIIFTDGHPDIDTGFISPELNSISSDFHHITVYPMRWENKSNDFTFPENISFKSEFALFVKSISPVRKKIYGLFSSLFWRNVLKITPSKYKSLLNTCGYITLVCNWLRKIEFDKSETLFYSYWLTTSALALSRLKELNKIRLFVSRAHGFDLYNERGDYILNHFKDYIFENINMVYCISQSGKKYLDLNYKNYTEKFTVSRLGTNNPFTITSPVKDSLTIVSCSFLSPVKRIELLINGLHDFQNKFPDIKLKWIHLGGGQLIELITDSARQKLQPGSYYFAGTLSVTEIYDYYAKNYFNCLINVSESEGLPVSIMEAQSFGIPVIATAVGGTPEIVNDENGLLLSENPVPAEIASGIYDVAQNRDKWELKGKISRKNWEANFNAEKNYRKFADDLHSLFNPI